MKLDNLNELIVTACKKSKIVRIRTGRSIIFAERFNGLTATSAGIACLSFERVYRFDLINDNKSDIYSNYSIPLGLITDIEFCFS